MTYLLSSSGILTSIAKAIFLFKTVMVWAAFINKYCWAWETLCPCELPWMSSPKGQISTPILSWSVFGSDSTGRICAPGSAGCPQWAQSRTLQRYIQFSVLVGLVENVPFELIFENCSSFFISQFEVDRNHVLLCFDWNVHRGKIQQNRSVSLQQGLV